MVVTSVVPNLPTPDPMASAQMYAEVLGLQVVMDHGWIVTLADADHPTAQLSLIREEATAPVLPAVSFRVDDADAAHARALAAGCEIVHPLTDEPWGVRRFFFRDTAGHVVNVVSHR